MLDSGGKSRVKETLQPLSGSAHNYPGAPSRALAVGNAENGAFSWIPSNNLFLQKGESKVPGARRYQICVKLTSITYIFQAIKSMIGCRGCHIQMNFFWQGSLAYFLIWAS